MSQHDSARIEELTAAVCSAPDPTDALAALADALSGVDDTRALYLREQRALRSATMEAGAAGKSLPKLRALYPSKHRGWLATMEAVGAIEGNLTGLPSGWWGQELPGRSAEGTYSHYDLHKLPPLPRAAIDSDLPWLRDAPAPGGDPTGSCQSEPWALLLSSLEAKGYALPAALHTLMTHEEMQRAIPAPTANYFIGAGEDGGESNAATLQEIREGVLFLPFYSDQQCCVRWGLWLSRDETGYAPVIAASLDFGEDGDGPVRYVDFEFSASTVESFVYRTWVENRIWFATKFCQPPRELLDFEKDYLEG